MHGSKHYYFNYSKKDKWGKLNFFQSIKVYLLLFNHKIKLGKIEYKKLKI